jgi:hypothetical protein
MTVVAFPRRYRHQLPADAIPSGKDRHAYVFPHEGKWAVLECDEGGGSFFTSLTKAQAVQTGIELVMDYTGTLEVRNTSLYDDEVSA